MKIGLLTSHRAQKKYQKEHWEVIHHLEKLGHEVVHSMSTSIDMISKLTYIERERLFFKHFQNLEQCDLIIAECSIQSTQVGFGLAYLREKGKSLIILSLKGSGGDYEAPGDDYSEMDNLYVTQYTQNTLISVLDEAVSYMSEKIDKRFTMIFPAGLMAKLEEVSRKKKLPKAVYIRQILEKNLK